VKRFIPLLLIAAQAWAYTVVVPDHVAQNLTHSDIGIAYVGGQIQGRVRSDTLGTLLPGNSLLYDGPQNTTTINRPADPFWDFLGVGAGESLYFWPQNLPVNPPSPRLYLGIAADGGLVPSGTFASYFETDSRVGGTARWIKLTLTSVIFEPAPGETREGYFSLWQTGGGSPVMWMSSYEGGVDATDATWLIEGGHAHFNWGFSARGYYRIEFQFSGFLAGSGAPIGSAPITYHFGVEHQPLALVPEPGAAWLLAAGALACGLRRPFSTSRTKPKPKTNT